MPEKQLKMPVRATAEELQTGLSPERLAELEAMAEHLRACMDTPKVRRSAKPRKVETAIEVAAMYMERSPATYRRAFSDLARAAGWASRTAEDYLLGRETTHSTSGEPRLTVMVCHRVEPTTKDAVSKAFSKFKAAGNGETMDDFLRQAAKGYLANGRF